MVVLLFERTGDGSPVVTRMIRREPQIDYLRGNGSCEIRMLGFALNAHTATARAPRSQPAHVGDHLREWRQRRHLSQLDLAGDAEISARHLSFVETGRAAPSRDMVLKLAERLAVPLRERNVLLVAAGFAPAFPQRSLDDPALKSARAAIDLC
jgi:transcriptional regulator with XRE-family HTH domain